MKKISKALYMTAIVFLLISTNGGLITLMNHGVNH
jgi:hypothetical protein